MPALCEGSAKGVSVRKASESCHLRLIRATPASLVMGRIDCMPQGERCVRRMENLVFAARVRNPIKVGKKKRLRENEEKVQWLYCCPSA